MAPGHHCRRRGSGPGAAANVRRVPLAGCDCETPPSRRRQFEIATAAMQKDQCGRWLAAVQARRDVVEVMAVAELLKAELAIDRRQCRADGGEVCVSTHLGIHGISHCRKLVALLTGEQGIRSHRDCISQDEVDRFQAGGSRWTWGCIVRCGSRSVCESARLQPCGHPASTSPPPQIRRCSSAAGPFPIAPETAIPAHARCTTATGRGRACRQTHSTVCPARSPCSTVRKAPPAGRPAPAAERRL
jgi:hypothetical protein